MKVTCKKKLEEGEKDVRIGRESQFVSDYAATNPGEDIAETLIHFVLKPKLTSDSIADQKVRHLYTFPDLIDFRKYVRNRLRAHQ